MRPHELLELLLEGDEFTPAMLDEFIKANPQEGQFHDYKDGICTREKSQRAVGRKYIREFAAAFANSEGGVLIIGVTEAEMRQISPCAPTIGNRSLQNWAGDSLTGMAAWLSPAPRFKVVEHNEGLVLLMAVSRAPGPVYATEDGKPVYWLRFDDKNLKGPDYLVSDVVLGRRSQPVLDLRLSKGTSEVFYENRGVAVTLQVELENLGLITMRRGWLGMVSWAAGTTEHTLNRFLRTHIDLDTQAVENSDICTNTKIQLRHSVIPEIVPFQNLQVNMGTIDLYPRNGDMYSAAVFFMPESGPLAWYELSFTVVVPPFPPGYHLRPGSNLWTELEKHCTLKRIESGRPRVSYRPKLKG